MGKEDNACECDVSENESRDLEAHDGCMWLSGVEVVWKLRAHEVT